MSKNRLYLLLIIIILITVVVVIVVIVILKTISTTLNSSNCNSNSSSIIKLLFILFFIVFSVLQKRRTTSKDFICKHILYLLVMIAGQSAIFQIILLEKIQFFFTTTIRILCIHKIIKITIVSIVVIVSCCNSHTVTITNCSYISSSIIVIVYISDAYLWKS